MNQIDFTKLKLVIWDLDETFWKGILSEGPVIPIPENISLIKSLTNHGIVNSICSKNDWQPTIDKLKELGVNDFFVFKSIDWTPKGPRIRQLIKDMGLRPVNCLFIDDNVVNLNEAKFYEKDLMIAEPSIIPELQAYLESVSATDTEHKRLRNYHVLEQKQAAKAEASNNLAFLYSSDTRVEICRDCMEHIERISELVARTNQLNYTKVRSSREELELLCKDDDVDTGYVKVCDRFGDYGIVGFFAVKDNRCLHFLFSCRTIGQGVEQYVYAILGHPILEVRGEVVNLVTTDDAPAWINQGEHKDGISQAETVSHTKIVLKGGCDLKVMSEYLQTDNVIEEFTYISPTKHNLIENQNHSTNYLQWPFFSDVEKRAILDECVFADEDMFNTSMYDEDVAILFLSTLPDANLGVYRRRSDGFRIAFGESCYPLTDPRCWDAYIKGTIFTAHNIFTREWLESFSEKYVFEGSLSPDMIIENVQRLLSKLPSSTKVCYILGSETPFKKNVQPNYEGRHLVYREINKKMRAFAANNERIRLIDVNEFIRGQEDFTNNINHFHRRVYYEIATKANEYIGELTGIKLRQKGTFYLWRKDLIDRIGYTGFYQTRIWKYLRVPYKYIIGKLK